MKIDAYETVEVGKLTRSAMVAVFYRAALPAALGFLAVVILAV
jgi:hypothetical protein